MQKPHLCPSMPILSPLTVLLCSSDSAGNIENVSSSRGLCSAIDAALQPAGMLPELSQMIADYARPLPKWDADNPHVKSGALEIRDDGQYAVSSQARWSWVASDCPVRDFPRPSARSGHDEKIRTALRVWSIRLDSHAMTYRLGVGKPSADLVRYAGADDPLSWTICTHLHERWGGGWGVDIDMPRPQYACSGKGSVYHFTADLSSGEVRVRPVISQNLSPEYIPSDPPQTEWTIAEGIADLAEYKVLVAVAGCASCTLLHSE